jgi:hypothetical protein
MVPGIFNIKQQQQSDFDNLTETNVLDYDSIRFYHHLFGHLFINHSEDANIQQGTTVNGCSAWIFEFLFASFHIRSLERHSSFIHQYSKGWKSQIIQIQMIKDQED